MLGIGEAINLFDRIHDNNELQITGLLITNSVDINFGRSYVRTRLNLIGNFSLYYQHQYISYPIDSTKYRGYSTAELQKMCNDAFREQKADIKLIKKKILTIFPDVSINVILSPYYCFKYGNIIMTGENLYFDGCDILDTNLKHQYDNAIEHLQFINERYKELLESMKEYEKKQKAKHKIYKTIIKEREADLKKSYDHTEKMAEKLIEKLLSISDIK